MIKSLFSFIFILSLGFSPLAIAQTAGTPADTQSLLKQANDAYYKNQLETAENGYKTLIQKGLVSGHLYYNYANVAYREGQYGKAIQYYEKALRLLPRNIDVRANLKFVEHKLLERQTAETADIRILQKIFFWYSYLTLQEAITASAVIFGLFWLFCWMALVFQKNWMKWGATALFMALILFGGSTAFKYALEESQEWAIVIRPQIEVHPTFLEKQKTLMTLSVGSKVRVLSLQNFKEDGSWAQIQLPNGQNGWVLREELGFI